MPREILVIKRDTLFRDNYFQGFKPLSETDYLSTILTNHEYQERNDSLESNPDFQQPIPYVWIVNPQTRQVFAFKRAANKNYTETRLRNKWSCGVGGHIDKDTEHQSQNPIQDAMMRELKEEVQIAFYPTPKIIGFINDDDNDVGKVHFGIVALAETTHPVEKGDEEMSHGQFYSIQELENIFSNPENDVENWTKISWPFVKSYVSSIK